MPAKRPTGDALCIWLIVETLRDAPGVTQEAAFQEIHDGLDPLTSRKRGFGSAFDTKSGKVMGDRLSTDRIEGLYKKAKKLLAVDEQLRAATYKRLAFLKQAFREKPGSRLLPFRERGSHSGKIDWWIVQWRPNETPVWYLANEPPPGYGITVLQSATPEGPFRG